LQNASFSQQINTVSQLQHLFHNYTNSPIRNQNKMESVILCEEMQLSITH